MPVQELELISTNEDEQPALQKMGAALLGKAPLSQPVTSSPPKLVEPNGETLEIPWSVFRALQQVVNSMKDGKACSVVSYDPSLDTQQIQNEGVKRIVAWVVSSDRLFDLQEAAGFLTCSESAVMRLLDSGEIPISVRDVLLRAADAIDIYELCLTDDILEETRRNLVKSGHVTDSQGQSLVKQLQVYFHDSFEMDYKHLIPKMPINGKDRHVLAAAVAGKAQIIVTENLKDFPPHLLQPLRVEAMSADTFLVRLFLEDEAKKVALTAVVREHINGLKKPLLTKEEALDRLEKLIPRFTQLIRKEL